MAGLVAHRIGIDLGRTDPIEEPVREIAGNQGACAGIVRMKNGFTAGGFDNTSEFPGDLIESGLP